MLKMFDNLLKDVKGNLVGKEGDFDAIREAKALPDLLALEQLQNKVDGFIEELRKKPRRRGEKKTRRELWEQPEGARKAPPIRQLMRLVPEKISRPTAIDYWKFQFDNQDHEPRLKSEEDLYRWMVAAARREHVPLRAAKFDRGWEIDICLDREDGYWCEGVLKTEQYLTKDQYPPMLGRVMARAEKQHRDKLEPLRAIMEAFGVNKAHKHDVTKRPIVLPAPEDAQEKPLAGVESHAQSTPESAPKVEQTNGDTSAPPSSVSIRTSPPRKPAEPVGRKFDWNKAPKAKEVLARIEGEIQKQQGGA